MEVAEEETQTESGHRREGNLMLQEPAAWDGQQLPYGCLMSATASRGRESPLPLHPLSPPHPPTESQEQLLAPSRGKQSSKVEGWVAIYLDFINKDPGSETQGHRVTQHRESEAELSPVHSCTAAACKSDQQGREEQSPFPGCTQGDPGRTLRSQVYQGQRSASAPGWDFLFPKHLPEKSSQA